MNTARRGSGFRVRGSGRRKMNVEKIEKRKQQLQQLSSGHKAPFPRRTPAGAES
jgi:hypothetical protein